MKKKQIALGFLATSLVAGAVPAFAAPADVKDAGQVKAVDRLSSFNVITGYEDGTFKPENNITRAEFAAIAIRLLGLEDAAKLSVGATKFSDVDASNWAAGYINVAVGQGILKGYPDGSFKPQANVTYAESLAILVRLLGYEPAVKGEWPNNYIAQAGSLGLTKAVGIVSANAPATRGNIAMFANSTLDVPKLIQVGYGTEVKFVVSGTDGTEEKTLITDNLGLDYYAFDIENDDDEDTKAIEGFWAVEETARTDKTLEGNEVIIDGTTYTLSENLSYDASDLLGQYVSFSATKNDEIVSVKLESTEKVGRIHADTTADKIKLSFDSTSKEYNSDVDATGIEGQTARLVIYKNKVVDVDTINPNHSGFVVTELDVNDDELEITGLELDGGDEVTYTIDLEDDTFVNGKTIKADDVKVGDLVFLNDADADNTYIRVAKAAVTGQLDSVKNDASEITVDGKTYDTAGADNAFSFSTDGNDEGKDVTGADDLDDLLGEEVSVYFNDAGDVAFVSGKVTGELADAEVLTVVATDDSGFQNYVKFLNSAGDTVTYKFDDDTKVVNEDNEEQPSSEDFDAFALLVDADHIPVKVKVDDKGVLSKVEIQDTDDAATTATAWDDDANTVTINNKVYRVNDDTKFYDSFDNDVVTGKDLVNSTLPDHTVLNVEYLIESNRTLKVAVVNAVNNDVDGDNVEEGGADSAAVAISDFASTTDSDNTYVVTSVTRLKGDDNKIVAVNVDGESKTFVADRDDVNVTAGNVYEFVINGDRITDSEAGDLRGDGTEVAAFAFVGGDNLDKKSKIITDAEDTEYLLSDDVVILDGSDDFNKITLSTLGTFDAEDDVTVKLYDYNDDTIYDFVIVEEAE